MPARRHPVWRLARLVPLLLVLWSGACGLRRAPEVELVVPAEDQRIQRAVEARLAAEPAIEAARIRVQVEGFRVQLHGSVRGIGAWNCAIRTASLVPGVQGVVDFLVIERGPRDVTCVATRGTALRLTPEPEPGGVTEAAGAIRLPG